MTLLYLFFNRSFEYLCFNEFKAGRQKYAGIKEQNLGAWVSGL